MANPETDARDLRSSKTPDEQDQADSFRQEVMSILQTWEKKKFAASCEKIVDRVIDGLPSSDEMRRGLLERLRNKKNSYDLRIDCSDLQLIDKDKYQTQRVITEIRKRLRQGGMDEMVRISWDTIITSLRLKDVFIPEHMRSSSHIWQTIHRLQAVIDALELHPDVGPAVKAAKKRFEEHRQKQSAAASEKTIAKEDRDRTNEK